MDADSEVLRSPIELSESSPAVLEHRSRLDARHSLADAVPFWLHQLNLIAEGIVRIVSFVSTSGSSIMTCVPPRGDSGRRNDAHACSATREGYAPCSLFDLIL
jgi:hypothetical protein